MAITPDQSAALRTARLLLDVGHPFDVVLQNPLIPAEHRAWVADQLRREQNITLTPARTLVADRNKPDWLSALDRSTWQYWPALRDYLLATKGWDAATIRSLDDSSDRIFDHAVPSRLPNTMNAIGTRVTIAMAVRTSAPRMSCPETRVGARIPARGRTLRR